MSHRINKDSKIFIKQAINWAFNVSYLSDVKLKTDAEISQSIIERIVYDSNNFRKTELN